MAFCRGCLLSTKGEVKDISHLNLAVEGLQKPEQCWISSPAEVIFGQKNHPRRRSFFGHTSITCIPSSSLVLSFVRCDFLEYSWWRPVSAWNMWWRVKKDGEIEFYASWPSSSSELQNSKSFARKNTETRNHKKNKYSDGFTALSSLDQQRMPSKWLSWTSNWRDT